MFDRISHEFLYDVSKDAVIRYLNDNGNKIRNLNDMNDEMISFLYVNRLHLYAFAREKGLHDKPVTKFSPDEEGLLEIDYTGEDYYLKAKVVRGMNDLENRARMYFLLKGCDDDTYFYSSASYNSISGCIKSGTFAELIEVHIDKCNFEGCTHGVDELFRNIWVPGISSGKTCVYFKDTRLDRYRFFNKTGNTIKW